MAVISKDLGPVSAYAVAVANGFTGTEAEWEQYIANASTAAQSAAGSATAAASSASAAAQSATAAAASQVAAAGSETEAANYALVAGNHAMAAAASATAAETAETGAETAQAAAEAAQAAAEAVAESIPEDYTELTEEVGSLKSALPAITGAGVIQFSDPALHQYIKTSTSPVSWDSPSTSAGTAYKWAVVTCVAGDKFTITGHGGSDPRLWAFCDSSKAVLSRSGASATANKLVLTAPTNAAYLIINDDSDSESYTGEVLIDDVIALDKTAFKFDKTVFANGYIKIADGTAGTADTRAYTPDYIPANVKKIAAKSGSIFYVHAYNGGVYQGTYVEGGTFAKTGTAASLTVFDFSAYGYAEYKITVLYADGRNVDTNTVADNYYIGVSDASAIQKISGISPKNMCLAGIQTDLADNKIPYAKGFLCHDFMAGSRKLYFGNRLDDLRYIGNNIGMNTYNAKFAISPTDGTIITIVNISGAKQIRIIKDNTYTNTGYSLNREWLYNSGVDFVKDPDTGTEYCVFAEYGANPGGNMYVHRGTYPYTSSSDWEIVKTVTGGTDIHHFHQVRRDPWTNILYLTSGDENSMTHWWYSTDCGATWTLLVSGSDVASTWGTMACRMINFIFTEDYIYWATDSYQNHMLCKIQRDAETGVIDLTTFAKITDLKAGCATNSLCYSEAPHGLFMYNRIDSGATTYYGTPVTMQFYNLDTDQLEDVVTLGLTEQTWGGSRGKCYINYTNPNQPYPAMGFDAETPCIFDLVYDDTAKIGTIVYDIKGGTVKDVLM